MTSNPWPSESGGESISMAPDWVPAEMPPGYRTRLEEIQRLSADLQAMDPFARLLWAAGPPLTDAVRDAVLALGFEAALTPGPAASGIIVKLSAGRLLLHVAPDAGIIRKKSPELAHVFQMMQELAEDADRVVLVANSDPATRPADRAEGIEPDAVAFLRRMGANFLASSTLFRLWMLSLHDQKRARDHVERLHAQDGGIFLPPPS
jgi:hypothetical protein